MNGERPAQVCGADQAHMNILDLVKSISDTDPWGNAMVAIRSHHNGRTTMAPIHQVNLMGSQVPQILIHVDGGSAPKVMRKHAFVREIMICLQRAPLSELAIQLPDRNVSQAVTEFSVEDSKGMLILDVK